MFWVYVEPRGGEVALTLCAAQTYNPPRLFYHLRPFGSSVCDRAPPTVRARLDKDVSLNNATARTTDSSANVEEARLRAFLRCALLCALVVSLFALAQSTTVFADDFELPQVDPSEAIQVSASSAHTWREGSYEVWLLAGDVVIRQGEFTSQSRQGVLWIDRSSSDHVRYEKTIAYLEGEVVLEDRSGSSPWRVTEGSHLARFYSTEPIQVGVAAPQGEPLEKPPLYQRAVKRLAAGRQSTVQPAQFETVQPAAPNEQPLPAGARRIRAFPRSDAPIQARWFSNPAANEWVAVIDSGVNIIVDGLEGFGSIDVSADRLVLWTSGVQEPDLTGQTLQTEETPLELYMEGNIVFRQGERVIYAERMYYDVRANAGTIVNAELLTPVPEYQGLLRMRAALVEQISRDQFLAQDAWITSSRLGKPTYRLQSNNAFVQDFQQPVIDPLTGAVAIDPLTGDPIVEHQRLITAQNNLIFLGPVPVFYWPTIATDLSEPKFYLDRIRFKNDNIFGTQVLTDIDLYQVLGLEAPPVGTKWTASADYLSDRGIGHGTTFTYRRESFLTVPGPTAGVLDYWAIDDRGVDNLGSGRRDIPPEKDYRYRLFWRHRQQLAGNYQLTAETGWISDRNFLEQYFENEWDQFKDQTTDVELKRYVSNSSWTVFGQVRLNDFFTQTEWLPRLDHFWLGQPLLGGLLRWYEHTSVGYGRLRVASPPEDPTQAAVFAPLPWEVTASGLRASTRHELDLPIPVGPAKIVPYALGEIAHWDEALDTEPLDRAYGQVGVRASLPLWSVNPAVESNLFNLHGLAHKIVLDGDFSYSDSNRDLTELPLYDPLDDDSIEHFRRRFQFLTFGGSIPMRFDERFYALRTDLQGNVTSPVTEIADDLIVFRLGSRQRWQTKRGLPGARRIIDWVVFDSHVSVFPDKDRDNFGELLGLADYDFRWHIGDRLTFVSDGLFDMFPDGQKIVTVGGFLNRPPRGNIHLGFRLLEGPISSQVLNISYNYRMSPKWVSTFGTSVDIGGNGNIGNFLALTRIGESFLVSFGFNVDESKDNVGVNLAIEPRFLPTSRLARSGGVFIPPAGALGLE